jgi:hypothetical protein
LRKKFKAKRLQQKCAADLDDFNLVETRIQSKAMNANDKATTEMAKVEG